jgi:hypothetical protein
MATQSVAGTAGSVSSSTGTSTAQTSLDKPSTGNTLQSQVSAETMAILVSNTNSNATGDGRKISFVIQDDPGGDHSKSSSQTTIAVQVRQ